MVPGQVFLMVPYVLSIVNFLGYPKELEGPSERQRAPAEVWRLLREGQCRIRYHIFAERADEAQEVVFPSGRVEFQLDGGRRLLEIRNPILDAP